MKYAWLEKLAEEGHISQEAREQIYINCSEVLEKVSSVQDVERAYRKSIPLMTKIEQNFPLLSKLIVPGAMGGVILANSAISSKIQDYRMRAATDINRKKITSLPAFSDKKLREKAEARFNEILKFAPSLGPNEAVMTKMVIGKINGLSNEDVQKLVGIEASLTKSPLDYAQASEKVSHVEPITKEEAAINMLADIYMESEKTASFAETTGHILRSLALPLGATAAITGAHYIKGKFDEKAMRETLSKSFETALESEDLLKSNPDKAKKAFAALQHFAPHIAAEPISAATFMKRLVEYNTGPNATDLKDLTDVEKNMMAAKGPGILDNLERGMLATGFGRALSETSQDYFSPYRAALMKDLETRVESSKLDLKQRKAMFPVEQALKKQQIIDLKNKASMLPTERDIKQQQLTDLQNRASLFPLEQTLKKQQVGMGPLQRQMVRNQINSYKNEGQRDLYQALLKKEDESKLKTRAANKDYKP